MKRNLWNVTQMNVHIFGFRALMFGWCRVLQGLGVEAPPHVHIQQLCHPVALNTSKTNLSSVWTPRSRKVHGDREQGRSFKWQRKENPEASNHLLQSAAAGPAPALPADPVPGPTGARRPGGQAGPHSNSGGASPHPSVLNRYWNVSRVFLLLLTYY